MKIAIDARLYGLENAGLGRYVTNLISQLSTDDTKNNYVIFLREKYFNSLNLPNNWKKVLVNFRHYSFQEQIILPFLIIKEHPDIVHFPHFNVPILYFGKHIVTIHDLLMHTQKGIEATTLSAPNYFIKRLGYNLVFFVAIKCSQKIIVPSNSVTDELVKNYPFSKNKIEVIYEGVTPVVSKSQSIKIQKPYFVYVGNAYPHKNLKRLIQAFVLLNSSSRQIVTLAIASARNNFVQRLEKLIHELDATKFVKLIGFVPDDKMGTFLENSTGFVFPSLSEGFGLPGLEAMSAKTLLLASEIPVFKEIYKDNAFYFNQLDFNSIERVIRNVLDLPLKERMERIKKAKEFVKRYSWDKMAKETLEVYKSVLK